MSSNTRKFVPIPPDMVPISGLNPYFPYVASARQVMFTGNLPQALTVDGRTRKRQQSGFEREVSRATFSHTFPRDAVVLAVIPRFSSTAWGDNFAINPMDLVIFEDYHTQQLDVIELSKFHVMHQHFGFQFEYDMDVYNRLTKGARFKEGTTIARSPAVTADGDYMYGLETNVCMLSHPSVTEDGVMYSKSYANRIRSDGFETRIIKCGRSHYPINWNGNVEEYKPLPDVGEFIQPNGLICAMRPYDSKYDPVYMSRKKLLKPVYSLDTPTYGIPDAQVVDIKVLHNDRLSNPRMPEEMGRQFMKYHRADQRYYLEIIKQTMCRNSKQMREDVSMSKRLRALVYEAIGRCGELLEEEGIWPKRYSLDVLRARKNYRGELLDEFQIEITYRYKTQVGEGPKVTDLDGGKGVGSSVADDEDMPTDEFGNRAEVVIFANSTVNRLNNGRQHEQVIGAAGRDIIKRIRRSYGLQDVGEIANDIITRAVNGDAGLALKNFDYLMGFYKLVAPAQWKLLSAESVIPSGRHIRHLIEVIKDGDQPYGLYLQLRSDSDVRMDHVINEIQNGPYMPEMSSVTYRDFAGKMVTTKTPVLIGPNYYLALEKTATDWSGVSSSRVNHFGTTTRLNNQDKHSSPGRQTVTRSIGESEARNLAAAMGGEYVADIMDMNNNPVVHKEVCLSILTSEKPTDIDRVVDREKFKLGGHRPLAYAIHQLVCSGKNISRE